MPFRATRVFKCAGGGVVAASGCFEMGVFRKCRFHLPRVRHKHMSQPRALRDPGPRHAAILTQRIFSGVQNEEDAELAAAHDGQCRPEGW
jgi:hypothetical protein